MATARKMRAKMRVETITKHGIDSESLLLYGVSKSDGYPDDGSDENNTFAKFTPNAKLEITIMNPDLVGTFEMGDTFYVDFTPVKK